MALRKSAPVACTFVPLALSMFSLPPAASTAFIRLASPVGSFSPLPLPVAAMTMALFRSSRTTWPLTARLSADADKSRPSLAGKAPVVDVVDERRRNALRRVPARHHHAARRVPAHLQPGAAIVERHHDEACSSDDKRHMIAQPPGVFLAGGRPVDAALRHLDRDRQTLPSARAAGWSQRRFRCLPPTRSASLPVAP